MKTIGGDRTWSFYEEGEFSHGIRSNSAVFLGKLMLFHLFRPQEGDESREKEADGED